MSYTEKMDVIDLIIEALKEHEKALDEIATRLDACIRKEPSGPRGDRPMYGASMENWR